MNYLFEIPSEITHTIFSSLTIYEIIDLYVHDDLEINKIFDDNRFWYLYFSSYGLPIVTHGDDILSWVKEFIHTEATRESTAEELSRGRSIWNVSIIQPIKILNKFINKIGQNTILVNYIQLNDSLYLRKDDYILKLTYYDVMNDKSILLSDNYNEIYDLVFKLVYYTNMPE